MEYLYLILERKILLLLLDFFYFLEMSRLFFTCLFASLAKAISGRAEIVVSDNIEKLVRS